MAAMSDKVLAEIQARAAMGRMVMSDIEIMLQTGRGMCHNWRADIGGQPQCVLVRKIPNQKIKVCYNCPLWQTTDVTYEDLYDTHVLQTYNWWREEYIRTGQTYARDRMVDFIKTWQPEPEPPVTSITITHWRVHVAPLEAFVLGVMLMLGVGLGMVLGIWIF